MCALKTWDRVEKKLRGDLCSMNRMKRIREDITSVSSIRPSENAEERIKEEDVDPAESITMEHQCDLLFIGEGLDRKEHPVFQV